MKASRLFPLAGIGAVILFVIAFAVGGETPDANDTARKISSFYKDNETQQVIAAICITWGSALLLLFAAGLWRTVRDAMPERRVGSTLILLGSTIFSVGATIFAGLTFALTDVAGDVAPGAMQALNALNADMFPTVALGTFTLLVGIAVSIIQTGILPKWLGWVAGVIGILAITPVGFFAFLVMGLVLLVVCGLLLARQPTLAPAAP